MIIEQSKNKIALGAHEEKEEALAWLNLDIDLPAEYSNDAGKFIVFEARKDYDYICMQMPSSHDKGEISTYIEAFITKDKLLILADHSDTDALKKEILEDMAEELSPGRGLFLLLARAVKGIPGVLDEIEGKIEELEEKSTGRNPEDRTSDYVDLRKELLALKKTYAAWYELYEEMEDNINGLFSHNRLKAFRIQKNRIGRILSRIMELQDYLSHVREAYQNQLAISLNETMQFFTVLTAVFLPPTLIVGWYGMNLLMPETQHPWTYPLVVIFTVVSVSLSLIYSRKKGWF